MKIFVEDDEGKIIFSTQVEVNGNLEQEPATVGIATVVPVKRALVAAAGIELGSDWWKEDDEDA